MSGKKAMVIAEMQQTEASNEDYAYAKDFATALPQFLAVSAKNLLLLGAYINITFMNVTSLLNLDATFFERQ